MDVREKLVELLEPHMSGFACEYESGSCELTSCRSCNAKNIADHLIAHGVTVQEWISVKDGLPEFCVSVLARCFYHGKWRTLVCHTSKENSGEWYIDGVGQWVKVTHWMPLPQLPKGE